MQRGTQPGGRIEHSGRIWLRLLSIALLGSVAVGCAGDIPVPTANSFPIGVTAYRESVWFTEFNGNKIGRINLDQTASITESVIPTANSDPEGIAVGSDGAIWFAESNTDKIGRLDMSSAAFTEFAFPTAGSPFGITRGPDGALWFTENAGNKIGRIPTTATPQNPQITEFVIPTANSHPLGITLGPDNALWFTERTGNKIGRIPTTATSQNPQIAEFVIPTANSGPHGITLGPDNALWFTERTGNKIGRIPTTATPQNPQITEFLVPADVGSRDSITAGPDIFVWFSGDNKLGRIATTPDHTITTYPPLTANPGVGGIAPAGPQQPALFYAESDNNRIGRQLTSSILGDLNDDAVVNSVDLAIFAQRFGTQVGCWTVGDLNGDCVVGAIDLAVFAQNFGKSAP